VYVKVSIVSAVVRAFLGARPELACIDLEGAWFNVYDSVESWALFVF
jgi:hypothetical protein